MAKRKKNRPQQAVHAVAAPVNAAEGGERRSALPFWLAAAALAVCGYSLLHKVDPRGANIWGIAAPALILAGYLMFIPAILISSRR